jgi:hypothetical protein
VAGALLYSVFVGFGLVPSAVSMGFGLVPSAVPMGFGLVPSAEVTRFEEGAVGLEFLG